MQRPAIIHKTPADLQRAPNPPLGWDQGGLVAPAIHDVERITLTELMKNLGEGGVETMFGVIYSPQVALVGFGSIREQRVVASVSGDHRVSDGHRGALFVAAIARHLQEPKKL